MIALLLATSLSLAADPAPAPGPAPAPESPATPAAPSGDAAPAEAPVDVRMWLDGKPTQSGGALVVQTEAPTGVQVDVPVPQATGLTFTPKDDVRTEQIGDRAVVTRSYSFSGAQGHYEIPPVTASYSGDGGTGTAAASGSVFVDLGVPPVRQGDIVDIAEPSPMRKWPLAVLGVAGFLLAFMAFGAWFAFRNREKPLSAVPPEPPDVVAIRAWEAVRKDKTLSDYDKALALSRIFREYAEAVLRFPATAFTTTETLEHLANLAHLPEGNVPRAKRLLRATDRVKYAEARAGGDLFDDLDADLRAFVGSTRPYAWEAPPAGAPA